MFAGSSSSRAGKGRIMRELRSKGKTPETLDPTLKAIFETFARGQKIFDDIQQQQQQLGEDVEMLDAFTVHTYDDLRERIENLRKDKAAAEHLDQQQKEYLLRECNIFGNKMQADTFRNQ